MTDSTLKTVIVLDPETQGYKPSGHNLTADAAVDLVNRLSEDNQKARVIDQTERHRSTNPSKCRLCKQAAEQTNEQSGTAVHDADCDTAAS